MQNRISGNSKVWLAGALCLFLTAGCTPSEDAGTTTGAASAPAEKPAAQAAVPQAAPAPTLDPDHIVEELYVDVEAEPDEGPPPLAVQFTAEVEDNTGAVECEWDMKDGSPKKTGLNPMHVFSEVADYEVFVLCKDAEGVEGEAEIDIFVEEE